MNALKTPEELSKLAAAWGGLALLGVMPGSPAAQLGLRYGDILLEVGEFKITHIQDFIDARKKYTEEIPMRLVRDGEEIELVMDLRAGGHQAAAI